MRKKRKDRRDSAERKHDDNVVVLPKEEFDKYFKRMKMPKEAREYHRNAKRKRKIC